MSRTYTPPVVELKLKLYRDCVRHQGRGMKRKRMNKERMKRGMRNEKSCTKEWRS